MEEFSFVSRGIRWYYLCIAGFMRFSWTRKIKIEEWLTLVAVFVVTLINVTVYKTIASPKEIAFLMFEYFTFGAFYYQLFFVFIYSLYFWKFCAYLWPLVRNWFLEQKPFPSGSGQVLMNYLIEPIRLLIPIVFISIAFYSLLSNFNYTLRFEVQDPLLLAADEALTGIIPFLYLPVVFSAPFFAALFKHAYIGLSLVLGTTLIILASRSDDKKKLYRKAILSFIMSLILSFPFFYFVPCNDPYHYFIKGASGNPAAATIQNSIRIYKPLPEIRDTMESFSKAETETDTKLGDAVPVSCFPSMHATWTFFVVYFLSEIAAWSLFLTVPWTLALLMGGVYYGQHYAVDYLVAVPIAAVSILLAYALIRLEEKWHRL